MKLLYFFLISFAIFNLDGHAQQSNSGHFEGKLILEDVAALYLNAGKYDPGHTEFKLIEDYTYVDKEGRRWTAKAGSVVNGASIPRALWTTIGGPWDGEYRNAAVIHDYMCENTVEDSDLTHRIFYEAMITGGVTTFWAKTMYFAVRKAGPTWRKGTNFLPPQVTRRGDLTEAEVKQIIETVATSDPSLDEIDKITR